MTYWFGNSKWVSVATYRMCIHTRTLRLKCFCTRRHYCMVPGHMGCTTDTGRHSSLLYRHTGTCRHSNCSTSLQHRWWTRVQDSAKARSYHCSPFFKTKRIQIHSSVRYWNGSMLCLLIWVVVLVLIRKALETFKMIKIPTRKQQWSMKLNHTVISTRSWWTWVD